MIYIVSPFENHVESRGTRNLALYRLLDGKKCCEFITSNFSHQNKRNVEIRNFDCDDINYKIIEIPGYDNNLSIKRFITHQIFAFKLFCYLIGRVESGDVIVVSSIPPEVVFVLKVLKMLNPNVKLHLDVRDIWPNAFPLQGFRKSIFSLYCEFFYKALSDKVDSISHVSPSFDDLWIKKFHQNKKSHFIPLGYDEKRWSVINVCRSRNAKIKLVYIGYLQSQFPLKEIILAVNSLGNTELHVVGDGQKIEEYKQISSNSIIFHGNLPLSEAAKVVSDCDVGVLPIFGYAQMPNKLFDYLGAGIPTFVLGNSDARDFILDNEIGWASDFEVDNVRDTIANMISNIDLMTSNVLKVRENMSKEFIYKELKELVLS